MAIENSVSKDFSSTLVDSINVFDCRLFGVARTVSFLCLFLIMPWVGLQCVILAFSGHTQLIDFWNVHGIMNTSGLLHRSIHYSMTFPKIEFIAYINILL